LAQRVGGRGQVALEVELDRLAIRLGAFADGVGSVRAGEAPALRLHGQRSTRLLVGLLGGEGAPLDWKDDRVAGRPDRCTPGRAPNRSASISGVQVSTWRNAGWLPAFTATGR
jgi:hypothetical protein